VERDLTEVATKYSLRAQKLERELTETAIRAQKVERELTETATRYSLWGQSWNANLTRLIQMGRPAAGSKQKAKNNFVEGLLSPHAGRYFLPAFGYHRDRAPTHGYAETREAAMAAFAKRWRRR
jgi:hypothetical protein